MQFTKTFFKLTIIQFSLNGDAFCRILQNHKKTKNLVAKCYSQWELNPEPLTLMPCTLLSELIPYLLEVSRPLDPYIVMLY